MVDAEVQALSVVALWERSAVGDSGGQRFWTWVPEWTSL
jgi:hypothetical protein